MAKRKTRSRRKRAKKGEIPDRNERVPAGPGVASSVGIVPGKLENRDSATEQIAELLETEPKEIEKKLSAKWVKDDSFVPIKTLWKVREIELMSLEPDAEILAEYERQHIWLGIRRTSRQKIWKKMPEKDIMQTA